jgi:diguanylate cyclase (GGDEF)-like protein/PAS domain S-box-containing protein
MDFRNWPYRWRAAPLILLCLIALSTYVVVDPEQRISVLRLGLGFAVGLGLLLPRRWVPWLAAGYAVSVLSIALLMGRTPLNAVTSAIWGGITLLLIASLGKAIGLGSLRQPVDVIRLAALGLATGAVGSTGVLLIGSAFPSRDAMLDALLQVLLGAAMSTVVGASLVLAESGTALRSGRERALEFLAVTGATLALLVGFNALRTEALYWAIPLFLLMLTLGWLGIRFGPWWASVGLAVASTWVLLGVVLGDSVFLDAAATTTSAIGGAQAYLLLLAFGVLLVSVYAASAREQAELVRQGSEMLTNALDGAEAQFFIKTYDAATGRFVYAQANEALATTLGMTPAQMLGRSSEELYGADLAPVFHQEDETVYRQARGLRKNIRVTLNGRVVTLLTTLFPVHGQDGEVVGVGGVSIDRTSEWHREELLQRIFEKSPVPTARLDWRSDGPAEIVEPNEALERLLKVSAEELIGQRLDAYVQGDDLGSIDPGRGPQRQELQLVSGDGTEITVMATFSHVHDHVHGEPCALAIFEDVTEARAAQAGLMHWATHDRLTELLNRQALLERLSLRESAGRIPAGTVALCCDIDGFKQIVDTQGYESGDRVLLGLADRLRQTVHPGDLVGRIGVDEFVVVSAGPLPDTRRSDLVQAILDGLSTVLTQDRAIHDAHVSMGVAIANGSVGAAELLRQADVALSRAKQLGGTHAQYYQEDLDRQVQLRRAMLETLSAALVENRLEVHAQPIVDVSTGVVASAEALVRLRDLDGTLLPPGQFIPVAEDSGLIVPLGIRVLDLALALHARWSVKRPELTIAVNVSPRQLADGDFPTTVHTLLKAHGVAPEQLVLEVTESTVLEASGPTQESLAGLRSAGVHVAIDDFGTGYSSLSSLRDLPADIIKIDRSFVAGLTTEDDSEAIVRAVLAMAHATGRTVVAEGVETVEQAHRLRALSCDRLQGYLFSKPLMPIDFDPNRHYALPPVSQQEPGRRS